MILDTGMEAGYDGYPLESPLLVQLLPIAQTAIQAFLAAEQDVMTQQSVVPSGGGTVVANTQQYTLDAKNQMLTGASSVLTGILERKADELAKLYPEGDLVPRGTLGYVLITSPLDLNLGVIGGSQKFLTKEEIVTHALQHFHQGSANVHRNSRAKQHGAVDESNSGSIAQWLGPTNSSTIISTFTQYNR